MKLGLSISHRLRSTRDAILVLVSGAACLLGTASAQAQAVHNRTWDGGGADSNWSTAANWDSDAPLAENTNYDVDLIFAGTVRLTPIFDSANFLGLTAGFNFRGITFSPGAGAFTISESGNVGLDALGNRSTGVASNIVNNSTTLQTLDLRLIVRGDLSSGLTFNTASGDLSVTTAMTSNGGTGTVTKSGTETLFFSAANSYTNATTISGGTLSLSGLGRLGSSAGTGLVSVLNTAIKLQITTGVGNGISDLATLSLAGGGTVGIADNGYLELGAGINEVIAGLKLNGIDQLAGTYGSTASSATFKNDEYFSGTGIVTVVPEPSAALLCFAALGALGWTRRRLA